MKTDPAAGARMLDQLLVDTQDAAYRNELIHQSGPSLAEMGRRAGAEPPGSQLAQTLWNSLDHVAEVAGPDVRRSIAEGLVQQIPDDKRLEEMTRKALEAGGGATLDVELSAALNRAGRPTAAQGVSQTVAKALSEARTELSKHQAEIGKLDAKLCELMRSFCSAMSETEQQSAINAFKARHQGEYQPYEAAAARLASLLPGAAAAQNTPDLPPPPEPVDAPDFEVGGNSSRPSPPAPDLRLQAEMALQDAPFILDTPAGQEKVTQALQAQANGQPTFLDNLNQVLAKANQGPQVTQLVGNAIVKSAGASLLSLTANGETAKAQTLLKGLARSGPLLGLEPKQMEDITQKMQDVLDKKPDALKKLGDQVRMVEAKAPGPIRALGLLAGIAGAASGWANFGQAELKEQIRTIGDSMQVGADGAMLTLQALGKSEQYGALSKLLGKTSAVGGFISAFAEGLNAIQSFAKGNNGEGAVSSMSAVGGFMLVAAAFTPSMAVPIVGALITLGGMLGSAILGANEHARELEDAEAFLKGGGLSDVAAKTLIDLRSRGPFITELAGVLNMQPNQLLRHLSTLNERQLGDFTQVARLVRSREENGQVSFDKTAESDARFLAEKDPTVTKVEVIDKGGKIKVSELIWPASLTGAAYWMRSHGLVP